MFSRILWIRDVVLKPLEGEEKLLQSTLNGSATRCRCIVLSDIVLALGNAYVCLIDYSVVGCKYLDSNRIK